MDTIYRVVRNAVTGKWLVMSVLAKGRKKKVAAVLAAVLLLGGGVATTASAGSIYVNDVNADGICTKFTDGATNITNDAKGPICNASSMVDMASEPAGTLLLNANGSFLKGNLSINGALDVASNKILSLKAGTSATDATNVGQLSPVVSAFGGDAKIDSATGAVTGPTFKLTNGGTTTTVADALGGLDTALSTANTNISTNAGNITALQSSVGNGTVGLVQQNATTKAITVASASGGSNINFAGTDGLRVLSGVGQGTEDTDAATVAQLRASSLTNPNGKVIGALTYDDISLASARLGGSNGTLIRNLAAGHIAAGSMDAVNGGQLFDLQQKVTTIGGDVGIIKQGISIGGSGHGSLTLVGEGGNSTVVGQGASATGSDSTALGASSSASGSNSVALGANSVADRDGTVSVGSASHARQIANVAAGTQRTDAANWGQVQDALGAVQDWATRKFDQIDRRLNGMGAMSAAMSQMAFSAQGVDKVNRLGVGVGTQGAQAALAVGYSRQILPNLNVSLGGSSYGRDTAVGAGVAFGW